MLKKCCHFLLCFTMIFIFLFQSINIKAEETIDITTALSTDEPETRIDNAIILYIVPVNTNKFVVQLENRGVLFDKIDYANVKLLIVPKTGPPFEKEFEFTDVYPLFHQSLSFSVFGSGWQSVYIISIYGRDGSDISLYTSFPNRTIYNPY